MSNKETEKFTDQLSSGQYYQAWLTLQPLISGTASDANIDNLYSQLIAKWQEEMGGSDSAELSKFYHGVTALSPRREDLIFGIFRMQMTSSDYENMFDSFTLFKKASEAYTESASSLMALRGSDAMKFEAATLVWKRIVENSSTASAAQSLDFCRKSLAMGSFFFNEAKDYDMAIWFFDASKKIAERMLTVPNDLLEPAIDGLIESYRNKRDYENTILYLRESLTRATEISDKVDIQFDIATQYDTMKRYYMALDEYGEVLKMQPDFLDAHQNMAIIYDLLGDFQKSSVSWRHALREYDKGYVLDGFANNPENLSSYADVLFYQKKHKTASDIKFIEKLYKESQQQVRPADDDMWLGLARLYREKRDLTRQMELNDGRNCDTCLNIAQAELSACFQRGLEINQSKVKGLSGDAKRDGLSTIGDFFYLMEFFEEALSSYQEALAMDVLDTRSRSGVGICHFKMGHYGEAATQFEKVLELDAYELNIRSNLADAYRMSGALDEAQAIYIKILNQTPLYLDACLGLGECFKALGDKANDKKDRAGSEDLFQKACEQFHRAIEKNGDTYASRVLGTDLLNAARYSLGYVKTRLYELGDKDEALLNAAKKLFTAITPIGDEYPKAQGAIRAINEQTGIRKALRNWRHNLIFFLALLLFLGAQCYAVYKFFSKETTYSLNRVAINAYLRKQGALDTVRDAGKKLASLYPLQFKDQKEALEKLDSALPAASFSDADIGKLVDSRSVSGQGDINAAAYASFTFGALACMIVGLFLEYITKLKLGVVEMEKNAVETVGMSKKQLISS